MKERIRTVRKNSSLNQTEFGKRIGATQAMITSYETGRVIPSDTTLKLISKEFGVSYDWLKTGNGPMMDPVSEEEDIRRLIDTYTSLPDRLKALVRELAKRDPEWYKTLDAAFDEIERRHRKRDAD